ncbi:unnamed protein product [Paramecium sonneborni]|uniref:Transmembrane protein n=1 Tax=Paramecium sonneborni TaxID=65129 RepID=A0A8S1P7A1_9CILI|nr:unnamed protein product [Paramecium sonneborni]
MKNFIILRLQVILYLLMIHYKNLLKILNNPEFYNPEIKLTSLPKELPIIQENEEIINTQQRLNGLITQIDQKIDLHQANQQVIEKIKYKYLPKIKEQLKFQDFPDFNPSDWPKDDDLDNLKIQQTKLQSPKQIFVKELKVQPMRNITFNSKDFNDLIQEQFQVDSSQQKDHSQKLLQKPKVDSNLQIQRESQILKYKNSIFKFPELNEHQIRLFIKASIILLILTPLLQLFTFIL